MDNTLLSALQDHSGPTFWISAAAIAAGASVLVVGTLLLGARIVRARRLQSAGLPRPARGRRRAAGAPAPPAAVTPPAAAGLRAYQAQAGGEPVAAPAPSEPDTGVEPGQGTGTARLLPILTRLRAAAARLEEAALSADAADPGPEVDSGLKTLAQDVEYVFRAGV